MNSVFLPFSFILLIFIHLLTDIAVSNTVIGEAAIIPNPEFKLDITCEACSRDRSLCRNVTVQLVIMFYLFFYVKTLILGNT